MLHIVLFQTVAKILFLLILLHNFDSGKGNPNTDINSMNVPEESEFRIPEESEQYWNVSNTHLHTHDYSKIS